MALPTNITVKRVREDTYAEEFKVSPLPTGATFELEVEGFTPFPGTVISVDDEIVGFPVASDTALAPAGIYDYDIVMTVGGLTRTIVEGKWNIAARTVTP
jgi:hypothetical protein